MKNNISRRKFVKGLAVCGIATATIPALSKFAVSQEAKKKGKPETNIKDTLKYPRTETSMPGKYPAIVVHVENPESIKDNKINKDVVSAMLEKGMLALTGAKTIEEAWKQFVTKDDVIGLKVNPVAGAQLSTSIELVAAIINQIEKTGVPKKNIMIWDRREFQLEEAGFTAGNFPGIKLRGTEQMDNKGSYYDEAGKLYGEGMIDKNWYYWADVEGKYDKETMPYMINEGKYSYFSKICTQEVTKIINIPILKNAGNSVTLALKNLAYGAISNTGRLHKELWAETCAEVCAFPPLRDKVVLNIVDAIKGCYHGGPGANPQFFTEFKSLLLASDPVAIDRIGYDIILKKRLEQKVQTEESPTSRAFLDLAEKLGLGTAQIEKIKLQKINM